MADQLGTCDEHRGPHSMITNPAYPCKNWKPLTQEAEPGEIVLGPVTVDVLNESSPGIVRPEPTYVCLPKAPASVEMGQPSADESLLELVEVLTDPIQNGGQGMTDCGSNRLAQLRARLVRKVRGL